MLKLSKPARNAAFAALLGTGLIGSAAVMLIPAAAQAQQWNRDWDDRGAYRGDWNNGYQRDWDDGYRGGDGRVAVGVYGYPDYYSYDSGYAYQPYDYDYDYDNGYDGAYGYDGYDYDEGPYCSDYDYSAGYCTSEP